MPAPAAQANAIVETTTDPLTARVLVAALVRRASDEELVELVEIARARESLASELGGAS
jgi:hypothetical protein